MGLFGWDLPPGCTQRHIDEAFGGDPHAEAFFDAMFEQFPAGHLTDEQMESLAAWAWAQVSKAYGNGYAQAQTDTALARDEQEADKLFKQQMAE